MSYNDFEGTIEDGYGAGTVMVWDRGSFRCAGEEKDPGRALSRDYDAGELRIELDGSRLKGEWALIRTRRVSGAAQWLLMKRRDEFARPGSDIVAEEMTSVVTTRTMEEIAEATSEA